MASTNAVDRAAENEAVARGIEVEGQVKFPDGALLPDGKATSDSLQREDMKVESTETRCC